MVLNGGTAGSMAHRNPALSVVGRSTTHAKPAGSLYRSPTNVWCETTACAGSIAFSKNAHHPYGKSLICQWFLYAPPGASPLFVTPFISGITGAGVIIASVFTFSSEPLSPQHQINPCSSMVGLDLAHDNGFPLILSSSLWLLACGIAVHFPSPSNRHAW